MLIPEKLQGRGSEPFGFVDDQQLDEPGDVSLFCGRRLRAEGSEVLVGADPDFDGYVSGSLLT